MDALEAILSRRSIRKYTDEDVPDETIERLLTAGMAAPSANNEQPWHFVVVRERAILDEIPKFHRYSGMLRQSPVAIVVCSDLKRSVDPTVDYWVQDCSAATENILIAANALGVGACWLGIHPRKKRVEALSRLLNLPDNIVPFCVIALGRAAESKAPGDNYDAERIHYERWE
jgi:nitroreductase